MTRTLWLAALAERNCASDLERGLRCSRACWLELQRKEELSLQENWCIWRAVELS